MATVRFYRIAREYWEAGDAQTCSCCNAQIRNVVEIDGNAYGRDCAAALLGWATKKMNTVADAEKTIEADVISESEMVETLMRRIKMYGNIYEGHLPRSTKKSFANKLVKQGVLEAIDNALGRTYRMAG